MSANGTPQCTCNGTYLGTRCEVNPCEGYCLNEGKCSLRNNRPTCDCKYTSGARCEDTINMDEICSMYCISGQPYLSSIDITSCR